MTVLVVAPAPLQALGVDPRKLPYATQTADGTAIRESRSLNAADFMNGRFAGVSINQSQDNPLQPDVQFRGFTGTPLLGGSEGVSVYVDGVRVNEVFGDTVNWDLIPEAAIEHLTLVSGADPVFGLNTLGGALSIETRNGFTSRGTSFEYSGGSFGRRRATIESGDHAGPWGWYLTGDLFDEDGWRDFSRSRAARLYGTLSWHGDAADVDLHAGHANTRLNGNGPAPLQAVEQRYEAIFTAPDVTSNAMTTASLRASLKLAGTRVLAANLFHRVVTTTSYNGDVTDATRCTDDEELLCDESGAPVLDQHGERIASEFNAINNLSQRHQRADGGTLQLTVTDRIAGLSNHFTAGIDAQRGRLQFDSSVEASMLQADRQTVRDTGVLIANDALSVAAQTNTVGVYTADTLSITPTLAVTMSARWNRTRTSIADASGDNPDLNGAHRFSRINPAAGFAWDVASGINLYGNYSQSARAPTPVELTCASEDAPCKLPNQFLADPDLKQVVAKAYEVGARGELAAVAGRSIQWHLGAFRIVNTDDILFQVTGGASSNEGFYANVGKTRRQGIEARAQGSLISFNLRWHVSATLLDATYQTTFLEVSANHPRADADGILSVPRGARIPGLPRNSFKAGTDIKITPHVTIGAELLSNTGQYCRSDEANLLAQLSGFTVINMHTQWTPQKNVSLFARIDNLFDRRYSTLGALGEPSAVFPGLDDPRFASPAAPRAAWVGARIEL